MKYIVPFFLMLFLVAHALAVDNSATRGDYATDFPSYRIAVGGNAYDQNKNQRPAFWGRNAAVILAGFGGDYDYPNGWQWFDSMDYYADVVYSRSIILLPYTDFHFWVECGDGNDTTGGKNHSSFTYNFVIDSLGLNKDDQFFKLADDSDSCVFTVRTTTCADASQGNRYWATADITDDSLKYVSQFGVYNNPADANYPGTDGYVCNYADTVDFPLWRALSEKRNYDLQEEMGGVHRSTVIDGYAHDNATYGAHAPEEYICGDGVDWWSFGGATGGQAWTSACTAIDWQGWPNPFTTSSASDIELYSRFNCSIFKICSTTASYGMISEANMANIVPSGVTNFAVRHGYPSGVILFFETQGFEIFYQTWATLSGGGNNGVITRNDNCISNGIPYIHEARFFGGNVPDTGRATWVHDFAACYQVLRDTALTYFCMDNKGNGGTVPGDTAYLANWDLLTLDLGGQIGSRHYVDTGVTTTGKSVHLYWREYENAFVLWYPPTAMADTINARSTNYYSWDCGEPVYELGRVHPGHMDSTYRSDGVIRIGPGTGVFALKQMGEGPPGVSNFQSSKDTINVLTTLSASIADDFGIDSVDLFVYLPDSIPWINDSVSIFDSTLGEDELSYNLSKDYTWTVTGGHWAYVVVVDDSNNVTTDSIYVDVQSDVVPPVISGMGPTSGLTEGETDSLYCTATGGTENYQIDSVDCYVWAPTSDSILVAHLYVNPAQTIVDYKEPYTWPTDGNFYVVFVAVNKREEVGRDSIQVTVNAYTPPMQISVDQKKMRILK